jgi:hypothetical protein
VGFLYRLTPPFFHVPEATNFSEAWERFCCKLLNIENKVTEIFVRCPPEQGVDLFYPSKKIAYQCKSIESGKSGDFNATHALTSYKSALAHQSTIGWNSYVLCTNVDVTGTSEATLRREIPGLEILPASYWTGLCETHSQLVERNFRLVVDIQPSQRSAPFSDDLTNIFGAPPLSGDRENYMIFLYCNRHDKVYRLSIESNMNVGQLLSKIRNLFRLPEATTFSHENISVQLGHSILLDGRKLPLDQTLTEAGVLAGDAITYWTQIIWKDLEREFRGDVIHMLVDLPDRKSLKSRTNTAIGLFKESISRRFAEVDAAFTSIGS